MARSVHFSRLLDIISGSALAGANTKVQKSALNKDFDLAKLESRKLRDLIDSNLPTFYVVDVDAVVYSLVQGLGLNNFQENEEYIRAQYPSKAELVTFLQATVTEAVHSLPKKPFLPVIDTLNKHYSTLLDTLAKRTSYIGYRNAATKFGASLRSTLKSSSVFVAVDGRELVSNLGKNSYVVIGPSFTLAVEKVNNLINDHLRKAFASAYDINLRKYSASDSVNRFTIGDFINAGHTAAYSDSKQLIGINMPLAQERQFLLSSDPKSEGIETSIADLYLNADYAIEFNQNYTQTATNLLNMQFSFVITMPQKYNTSTLRTQEVARIKEYIGNTILPSIVEQAKKKFVGGILQDITLNSSASPTLLEYFNSLFSSTLQSKPAPKTVKTSRATAKSTNSIPVSAIVKDAKKLKVKSKSGGTKVSQSSVQFKQASRISLTSLQNLINSQLQDVISANMGSGSSRNVLNYRTGRLASSAKVESMSESRAGMVTAFYTYMKNPYATFSQGGQQASPASRDPKLLIAKSIREIAQQQVANRMRAVAL
jgi:hypothetical protein